MLALKYCYKSGGLILFKGVTDCSEIGTYREAKIGLTEKAEVLLVNKKAAVE